MHTVAIYSYEDRMSSHRQKVRDFHGDLVGGYMLIDSSPHRLGRRSIPRRCRLNSRCRVPRAGRYHSHRSRAWCRYDPPRVRPFVTGVLFRFYTARFTRIAGMVSCPRMLHSPAKSSRQALPSSDRRPRSSIVWVTRQRHALSVTHL
jgi:hypothetical protein